MSYFRKKPVVIEAFTFRELVQHGVDSGASLHGVNRMPWSFDFRGHPITHENDDCYLIPNPDGGASLKFHRGDRLCANHIGDGNNFWWNLWVVPADIFAATYEPADLSAPDLLPPAAPQ